MHDTLLNCSSHTKRLLDEIQALSKYPSASSATHFDADSVMCSMISRYGQLLSIFSQWLPVSLDLDNSTISLLYLIAYEIAFTTALAAKHREGKKLFDRRESEKHLELAARFLSLMHCIPDCIQSQLSKFVALHEDFYRRLENSDLHDPTGNISDDIWNLGFNYSAYDQYEDFIDRSYRNAARIAHRNPESCLSTDGIQKMLRSHANTLSFEGVPGFRQDVVTGMTEQEKSFIYRGIFENPDAGLVLHAEVLTRQIGAEIIASGRPLRKFNCQDLMLSQPQQLQLSIMSKTDPRPQKNGANSLNKPAPREMKWLCSKNQVRLYPTK